jgi:hypothetical protein
MRYRQHIWVLLLARGETASVTCQSVGPTSASVPGQFSPADGTPLLLENAIKQASAIVSRERGLRHLVVDQIETALASAVGIEARGIALRQLYRALGISLIIQIRYRSRSSPRSKCSRGRCSGIGR